MMKTQIGLGVLSIPAVLDALGMVPGVICLIIIGIITTWSDYMVGVFKLRHRSVYSIDDVGDMLFGRVGRIVFGTSFVLCECSLPPNHTRGLGLTGHSLDFRCRSRNARNLDWPERSFDPRRLYRSLRRRRCHNRILSRQHPDA